MMAFRSLRNRPFANLWSGQTISRLGDALYQIALAWWVLEKTGSATTMGLVLVFSIAPAILFALIGGVLVDRLPRFRIMLSSDLVRGVIVIGVSILAYADRLEVWHIFIASLLFGIVDAFFQPAYMAAVPEIVDSATLPSANSLTSLSQQAAGVLGPLLGAILVKWGGTPTAFLLDGISFFISAAFLIPLQRMETQRPAVPATKIDFWKDMRDGLRIVFGLPWIWITILLASLGNVTRGGPTHVAIPFIMDETLKAGVDGLGWFRTVVFFGSVVGALWVGRMVKIHRRGWITYGAMILAGFMTIWIGIARTIEEVLAAGLVIGICTAIFNLLWITTLQETVAQDKLGRVASIDYLGSLVFVPIGFAVTGFFTDIEIGRAHV